MAPNTAPRNCRDYKEIDDLKGIIIHDWCGTNAWLFMLPHYFLENLSFLLNWMGGGI